MRALIFSDLHLAEWGYGAYPEPFSGENSRLHSQALFLDGLIKYIESNDIDHLVFCGDWFHTTRLTPSILKVTSTFLKLIPRNVRAFLIVGNHDMKSTTLHSLEWVKGIFPNVVIVDKSFFYTYNHYNISMLPFTESMEALQRFLEDSKNCDLIFMHQGVRGIKINGFEVPNELLHPDMISDKSTAFAGHYHTHKTLGRLVIPGSPMQHTWGDAGENKGFLVWTDGILEFIENKKSPQFIRMNLDDPTEFPPGSFIRVINPIEEDQRQDIRDGLIKQGATLVEFEVDKQPEYKEILVSSDWGLGEAIEAFEEPLSEFEKEVGRNLRQ